MHGIVLLLLLAYYYHFSTINQTEISKRKEAIAVKRKKKLMAEFNNINVFKKINLVIFHAHSIPKKIS